MTRPTAVLLAVVGAVVTFPAVLAWGAPGVFVNMAAFAGCYGLGLLIERIVGGPERYP